MRSLTILLLSIGAQAQPTDFSENSQPLPIDAVQPAPVEAARVESHTSCVQACDAQRGVCAQTCVEAIDFTTAESRMLLKACTKPCVLQVRACKALCER